MENSDMSEMINKISSMLNNAKNEENGVSSITPEVLSSMAGMLSKGSKSSSGESPDAQPSNNNIDLETILELKNAFDKINSKDDKRSKLLLALKPYLKDDKKQKIDKYIQFLNISKIINTFDNSAFGGDKK